jgi:formylglycine-generating enzyme required for sulfatase activity/DNA-binding NarL/FixJ family response regulator
VNILLVDDDNEAINAIRPFLESIPDVMVRSASSGDEALEMAKAWGTVNILLTDIAMEPMNGFTLRNKLENRHPGVKTIFMSGYSVDEYAEYTSGCPVLVKPFDSNALLALISEATPPKAAGTLPSEPNPRSALHVAPEPPETSEPSAVAHDTLQAPAVEIPSAPASATALVGQTLGNYKIISLLSESPHGTVYEAVQTSMNRPVALKVLALALQQDVTTREQFIADAQAKAKVQHPVILSVYEAGESGPYCYYTLEYVEGMNVAGYAQKNLTLDDALTLQLIRATGEGLLYLDQHKISHNPLEARNLYIDSNKHPRLANIATQHESHPETQKEIISLSQIIRKVLPDGRAADPALQALMHRMSVSGNGGFLSWASLLQAVKALEPKVIPSSGAFKISAQDVAAIHAVEEAQQRKKRALMIKIGAAVALVGVLFVVYWFFFRTNERIEEVMVKIPAGDFIFQDGQKMTLPEFWIDQYEVTIGQYAKFLKYFDSHPEEASKYEHPDQPKGKSHKPKTWDLYYNAARSSLEKNRKVDSVPIDLDYPVFGVDWWDAYAYAKWMKRRLPTEQEWEKAGRGTDARLYPWGNDFDPKKCNSAIDFNTDPHIPGAIDGYNRWSPVDAFKEGRSPYDVYDMAGNVSEWTASTDPTGKFRIARGGSCRTVDDTSQPDVKITKRFTELYPNDSSEYLGFRTAADQPPDKK